MFFGCYKQINIRLKKIFKKNDLLYKLYIKGYRMDKNYLRLKSRGNSLKALKKVGCRGLESDKKSVIYYTLKCFKGY